MNKNNYVIFFFFAMCVSTSAWAKNSEVKPPERLSVISVVSQDEIGAWLDPTSFSRWVGFFMAGTLGFDLGGIADGKQNSNALRVEGEATGVNKYRDELGAFDFRTMMHKTIQSSLNKSTDVSLLDYRSSELLGDFKIRVNRRELLLKKEQFLRLQSFYFFDLGFNVIYIKTVGHFFRENEKSGRIAKKKFSIIYQSSAKEVYYEDVDFKRHEEKERFIYEKYAGKILKDRKNKKHYLRQRDQELKELLSSKSYAERKLLINKKYAKKIFLNKKNKVNYEHKMDKELKRLKKEMPVSEQVTMKRVVSRPVLDEKELALRGAEIDAKYAKKIEQYPSDRRAYERARNSALKRLRSTSMRPIKRESDWNAEEMRLALELGASKIAGKILYFMMNDLELEELEDKLSVKVVYRDGSHLSEPNGVVAYEISADGEYGAYYMADYGKNNLYIVPKREPILYPK